MFLFLTDFFCNLVCAHVCAHWYRGVQPIESHLNPKYWFYTLRAFTAVYKEFKCWSFLLSIRETETKKNLSLWNGLCNFSLSKRLLTSTFKLAEQFTSIIFFNSEFHRLILHYVRITFLWSKCCHSQVLWDKVNRITPLDFLYHPHYFIYLLLLLFPFQSPLNHLPHAESIWNVPWKAKFLWVQELVQTLLIATCLCFKNSTLNMIHVQWKLSMRFYEARCLQCIHIWK